MIKAMVTFAALAALLLPAHGAGENKILRGTVVSKFDAEDLALMKASVGKALTSAEDGITQAWKNDKTGASGSVTPLGRLASNGLECRRVRIVNELGRTTREGVYRFCEKPPGQWKLVGPDRSPS
jgi:surface antigen